MHYKEIIGMKVITADGWTIGSVSNVATNPADWSITSLEVNIGSHAADSGILSGVTTRLGNAPSPPSMASTSATYPQNDTISITPSQIEGVVDKVTLKVARSEITVMPSESTATAAPGSAPPMSAPAPGPGAY